MGIWWISQTDDNNAPYEKIQDLCKEVGLSWPDSFYFPHHHYYIIVMTSRRDAAGKMELGQLIEEERTLRFR